jgi:hypothetical protein
MNDRGDGSYRMGGQIAHEHLSKKLRGKKVLNVTEKKDNFLGFGFYYDYYRFYCFGSLRICSDYDVVMQSRDSSNRPVIIPLRFRNRKSFALDVFTESCNGLLTLKRNRSSVIICIGSVETIGPFVDLRPDPRYKSTQHTQLGRLDRLV